MKLHPLAKAQFAAITDLVCARTGLAFGPSRRMQADAGIRQSMAAAEVTDPDRFLALLQGNDRAFHALVETLTVAETYFFREPEQFDVLRRMVLPTLRRRDGADARLRLWSAGCATGEEAYSLAILLEQEGLAGETTIVATGISRAALAHARKGVYGAWSFRDNAPEAVAAYFHPRGDKRHLIERIRQAVAFDVFNLASVLYPPRITGPDGLDVILCRNVLIYFDPPTVERVARQMFAALRDGGWLIAGPSDPPLWPHAPYETVLTPAGVFYRRGACAAAKAPGIQPAAASIKPTPVAASAAREPPPPRRSRTAAPTHDRPSKLAALVNGGDPQRAAAAVAATLATNPLSPEAHYLNAIVLMSAGRYEGAAAALRKAIYLDRSLAVAHFALASIAQRRGAVAQARRSYRNVLTVCGGHRADEIVPLSDGEPIGRLIEAARVQLALIRHGTEGRS